MLTVTEQEFGLWYEEQTGMPGGRLLCAFAARVNERIGRDEVARALGRVFARHPECGARFIVDADGLLGKTLGAADMGELAVFSSGEAPDDVISVLAAQPVSAVTGPLLRLAIRVDRAGMVDLVAGIAHHVVWDARSEDLFWASLSRELTREPVAGEPRVTWVRPTSAGTTVPDPQWRAVVADGLWDRLRRRAIEHTVTPFAWTVGHLATAVAAWSRRPVTPYVDVDLRAIANGTPDRIGYFQVQCRLRDINEDVAGVDATRQVSRDVAALITQAMTVGLAPEPEEVRNGVQPCKFYLPGPRPGGPTVLSPLDVAMPVARNDLAVGLTSAGERTHLTVTARHELFGRDEPRRLGRHLLAALDTAAGKETKE